MKYMRVLLLIWSIGLSYRVSAQVDVGNRMCDKVVRLTTGEWPPYASSEQVGNGVICQIVEKAFELEGYRVELGFFPWARSLEMAREGQWDGSIAWIKTPEREADFRFSHAIMSRQIHLFRLKRYSFRWEQLSDLKGQRMGLTRGYAYSPGFRTRAHEDGIRTIDSDTDLINLNLLHQGRIHWHLSDYLTGLFLINHRLPPEVARDLTLDPVPISSNELHLICSKSLNNSQELIDIFNRGLTRLKSSGQYQTLVSAITETPIIRVGITHWPPWKIYENGEFGGIDVDIVREMARRTGLDIELVHCTWKRCIEMLRSGDLDMVTSFGYTDERDQFSVYIEPSYSHSSVCFYARKGETTQINGIDDLVGRTVGHIKGASYFREFNTSESIKKMGVANDIQLFKMLDSGRVDFIIGFETARDRQIQLFGFEDQVLKLEYRIEKLPVYLALSRQSPARVCIPMIEKALEDMLNDGFIEKAIQSHTLQISEAMDSRLSNR